MSNKEKGEGNMQRALVKEMRFLKYKYQKLEYGSGSAGGRRDDKPSGEHPAGEHPAKKDIDK